MSLWMTAFVRTWRRGTSLALGVLLWSTGSGALHVVSGQGFVNFTQRDGHAVLKVIKRDIEKHYYDSTFHGIDLEAQFEEAREKIDSATSTSQVFAIIAQALLDLNDSHTAFWPPSRAARTEYGWQMRIIGDLCYVAAVQPGSDAEAKGLKVGEIIRSIGAWAPTRDNMSTLEYGYYTIWPQRGMRLLVGGLDGQERQLDVMAKIKEGRRLYDLVEGSDYWRLVDEARSESRLYRDRYHEIGEDVIIWKMPRWDMSPQKATKTMDKVRKFPALILDLRGNSGGYVSMLERLTGHFFDRDIKIADWSGRTEFKPSIAKTQGKRVFNGKLVVLVDSESASASEVFARLIQLEGRGTVIGDRTRGAVMVSRFHHHTLGYDRVVSYGTNITMADVIMSDGKSLEGVGVTPDEVLLPTMKDLASGRDPVLARAAELVGVELGAEQAGRLFPIEWVK